MSHLLTRDSFRERVFQRDDYKCVICKSPEKLDAHHIIERRLFPDGGYYIDNGASLCPKHHIEAEMTVLSVEQIRQAAGIARIIIPPQFYNDEVIDKWGNVILSNGRRMQGELFLDESVQKALHNGGVLPLFTKYIKYPRTFHLPFSLGVDKSDRVMHSTDHFQNKEVVVTVKLDGENCSMYCDHVHARSLDSSSGPTQSWIKNFHAQVGWEIPEGWRVCGENLYAAHSIQYDNLTSYFYGFSVWNDRNICLSWDETGEWLRLLGIEIVPVLYRGIYDEELIKSLYEPVYNGCECEGFVVRLAEEFPYKRFTESVGKFVRKNHVRTHDHWRTNWKPNKLAGGQ